MCPPPRSKISEGDGLERKQEQMQRSRPVHTRWGAGPHPLSGGQCLRGWGDQPLLFVRSFSFLVPTPIAHKARHRNVLSGLRRWRGSGPLKKPSIRGLAHKR